MKKAIISQPMRDKTEAQIRQERADAAAYLEGNGYEVTDTIFQDTFNGGSVPLKYLAKSLEAIAGVDLVYFLAGWEEARGCRIEHEACKSYGIKTMYAPDAFNEEQAFAEFCAKTSAADKHSFQWAVKAMAEGHIVTRCGAGNTYGLRQRSEGGYFLVPLNSPDSSGERYNFTTEDYLEYTWQYAEGNESNHVPADV